MAGIVDSRTDDPVRRSSVAASQGYRLSQRITPIVGLEILLAGEEPRCFVKPDILVRLQLYGIDNKEQEIESQPPTQSQPSHRRYDNEDRCHRKRHQEENVTNTVVER